ncbi:MAG TPA: hypothetical protein VK168_15940 [Saprospiraceae bacterium]|nr:hypothetical protein [Saprospiraceae bacterium]
MNTAARLFAPLLLVAFLLSSCHTAQKYVESGDYDSAIDLCIRKLKGKPKKKEEYVKGLELAFRKAQARDLNTVDQLKAENRPELWERIHDIHLKIRDRQNKVAPLTPLVAKNGYRAQFQMVDIASMERDSREKAADYLYTSAENLLKNAEKGDKLAARKAHGMLQDLQRRYYPNFREKDKLLAKARDLGTSYVLVEVKNLSNKVLPKQFAERLLSIDKSGLDSEWRDFSFVEEKGLYYDYRAVLKIRDIDISPERVQERAYIDEKKIQDGWDYVLDKKGNVMKDSLGNDIKTPRMVIIRADVLEVFQSKAARIAGAIEIRDHDGKNLLETCEVSTEVRFENYASTFRGDERALTPDSKARIGNRPLPFPKDEDMLSQAADRLKPEVKDELRSSRSIL